MGKKIKASSHSSKVASCTSTTAADKSSPPITIQRQQQVNTKGKTYASNQRKGGRSKTNITGGAIVDKELSSALLSAGYRIKYMVGDGNCLFRSIADQLRYNKIFTM